MASTQVKEQQFLNDLRKEEKDLLGQSHDLSQQMLKTSFEINKLHKDDEELQRRITQSTGEEREFYVKKRKEVLATIDAKRVEQDQSRDMVELVEMEYKKRVLLNKVLAKNGEQVQGFLDKTKNIGDSIE